MDRSERESSGISAVVTRSPRAWASPCHKQGRAVMRLSTGTRITLSRGGAARASELGALTRFDLSRGTFGAEVVKLVPGERFLRGHPGRGDRGQGNAFRSRGGVDSFPLRRAHADERRRSQRRRGRAVCFPRTALTAGQHWPDCPSAESDPPRAPPVFERRKRTGMRRTRGQPMSLRRRPRRLCRTSLQRRRHRPFLSKTTCWLPLWRLNVEATWMRRSVGWTSS